MTSDACSCQADVTPEDADATAGSNNSLSPSTSLQSSHSLSSSPSTSSLRVRHVCVTIHGYLGLPRPFFLFRAPLVNSGYYTVDYSYSSGSSIEEIVEGLIDVILETQHTLTHKHQQARQRQDENNMYDAISFSFVCHSLGGLVLRAALSSNRWPLALDEKSAPATATHASGSQHQERQAADEFALLPCFIGRIVMVGTPNRGSLYARRLAQIAPLRRLVLGLAKLQLTLATIVPCLKGRRKSSMRGAARIKQNDGASMSMSHMSATCTPSSSSTTASPADAALSDVLACGEFLMSRDPAWFTSHYPIPPSLYPRILVIAGTLSLTGSVILPKPNDGTIAMEETYLPHPSEAEKNGDDNDEDAVDSNLGSSASAAFRAVASSARWSYPDSPVSLGPAGSLHMSFHTQHSLLIAHPGVIAAALQFIQTGNPIIVGNGRKKA